MVPPHCRRAYYPIVCSTCCTSSAVKLHLLVSSCWPPNGVVTQPGTTRMCGMSIDSMNVSSASSTCAVQASVPCYAELGRWSHLWLPLSVHVPWLVQQLHGELRFELHLARCLGTAGTPGQGAFQKLFSQALNGTGDREDDGSTCAPYGAAPCM